MQLFEIIYLLKVCHSPLFFSDYFSQCLIWSQIISGYRKPIIFLKCYSLTPIKTRFDPIAQYRESVQNVPKYLYKYVSGFLTL